MLLKVFKRIVFWSYGRTTWQYDVLCVLILAFVFLTPKGWFEWGKLDSSCAHQKRLEAARQLLVRAPEAAAAQPDARDVERCAKQITDNPNLRVTGWRKVQSVDGRTVAYEVDIEP